MRSGVSNKRIHQDAHLAGRLAATATALSQPTAVAAALVSGRRRMANGGSGDPRCGESNEPIARIGRRILSSLRQACQCLLAAIDTEQSARSCCHCAAAQRAAAVLSILARPVRSQVIGLFVLLCVIRNTSLVCPYTRAIPPHLSSPALRASSLHWAAPGSLFFLFLHTQPFVMADALVAPPSIAHRSPPDPSSHPIIMPSHPCQQSVRT